MPETARRAGVDRTTRPTASCALRKKITQQRALPSSVVIATVLPGIPHRVCACLPASVHRRSETMKYQTINQGRKRVVSFEDSKHAVAYHYTNAAGLIGIIQNSCLWASSPVGLNDLVEFTYGVDVIAEVCKSWPKDGLSELQRRYLAALSIGEPIKRHFESVYYVSASASSDSLSQWRNYSGRLGYCIGIDTTVQLAVVDGGGTSRTGENYERISGVMGGWYDVVYNSDQQQKLIWDFISESLRGVDEAYGPELMVSRDSGFLATLASTMKHATFAEEQEIRFVASKLQDMHENFRAGDFGVIPYVEVAKATDRRHFIDSPQEPLPLTQVTCGPANSSEQPLVEGAVVRLLKDKGYEVPVVVSTSPYRF